MFFSIQSMVTNNKATLPVNNCLDLETDYKWEPLVTINLPNLLSILFECKDQITMMKRLLKLPAFAVRYPIGILAGGGI